MEAAPIKRVRCSNMSAGERALLVDLASKFSAVIENKRTDSITVKEKEVAWQQLHTEFVAAGGCTTRSWKQLKNVCSCSMFSIYMLKDFVITVIKTQVVHEGPGLCLWFFLWTTPKKYQ